MMVLCGIVLDDYYYYSAPAGFYRPSDPWITTYRVGQKRKTDTTKSKKLACARRALTHTCAPCLAPYLCLLWHVVVWCCSVLQRNIASPHEIPPCSLQAEGKFQPLPVYHTSFPVILAAYKMSSSIFHHQKGTAKQASGYFFFLRPKIRHSSIRLHHNRNG